MYLVSDKDQLPFCKPSLPGESVSRSPVSQSEEGCHLHGQGRPDVASGVGVTQARRKSAGPSCETQRPHRASLKELLRGHLHREAPQLSPEPLLRSAFVLRRRRLRCGLHSCCAGGTPVAICIRAAHGEWRYDRVRSEGTARAAPCYAALDPCYAALDPCYAALDPCYAALDPCYAALDP